MRGHANVFQDRGTLIRSQQRTTG